MLILWWPLVIIVSFPVVSIGCGLCLRKWRIEQLDYDGE